MLLSLFNLEPCLATADKESGAETGSGEDDMNDDGDSWPEDCDDHNSAIPPGAMETCDGVDENGDDAVDDGAGDDPVRE